MTRFLFAGSSAGVSLNKNMTFRALIFLFLLVDVSFAQSDWRQNLTPSAPGRIPLPRPFRATYNFGWAGFTAARADAVFSRSSGDQLRMDVRGGTTGFVRALWRMDATHIAVADATTLLPVSVRQVENYRSQTLKTNLDFNQESVTRVFMKMPQDKAQTPVVFKFPNIRDMFCTLFFLRSERLAPGDAYSLAVYPGTSPYLVTARVTGKDVLDLHAGKFNAVKVDVRLWKITRDFRIEPHSKCKHAVVWVSDDADRLPLKAQADVFVGSIWGELQKVSF